MSTRAIRSGGGPGVLSQVMMPSVARALRYPEIVAAFWPRRVAGTSKISASRIESLDAKNPNHVWRTIAAASGAVALNRTLADSAMLYSIADSAIADVRLWDRDTGAEAQLRVNPRATGGFSVVHALRYADDTFARSVSVASDTRDIYMGPRGFPTQKFYAGYDAIADTTSANFLLQGTQANTGALHVAWFSVDYATGDLVTGADTLLTSGSRVFSKTVTVASDLPQVIDYARVGHRNSGRIDNCFLGPAVFIAAPIHRTSHRALRESVIGAVAEAVGVTLG